jgi:hypothetical protein
METLLTTVPAHFDGTEIKLDIPVPLATNARLLITILDQPDANQVIVEMAMRAAAQAFARVWNNDEDAAYDDL